MQSIGGNHWLGGKKSSTIGWCHVLLELIVKRILQYYYVLCSDSPNQAKGCIS
jgi:hypothetical protein